MTSPLKIATDHWVYWVSPDNEVPSTGRFRGLVTGQVVDEITGAPPRAPVVLTVEEAGCVPRVTEGKAIVIGGVPLHFLSLANVGGVPLGPTHSIHLTLETPGYLNLTRTASVPQPQNSPTRVPDPVNLGNLPLHREAVVIAGRVVSTVTGSPPVAGATVRISGYWPTLQTSGAPSVPSLVALNVALYADRNSGTSKARTVKLAPSGAPPKSLRFPAPSGTTTLFLDHRDGLANGGGDLLCLDRGTEIEEFILTASVQATATVNEPAAAELVFALRHTHGRGAPVDVALVSAPGADKSLAQAAIPGDAVIFLSDIGGWSGGSLIEIHDASAAEYHSISRFDATADADGFYRLPPISRVAVLEFEVNGATIAENFSVDYNQPINALQFRI